MMVKSLHICPAGHPAVTWWFSRLRCDCITMTLIQRSPSIFFNSSSSFLTPDLSPVSELLQSVAGSEKKCVFFLPLPELLFPFISTWMTCSTVPRSGTAFILFSRGGIYVWHHQDSAGLALVWKKNPQTDTDKLLIFLFTQIYTLCINILFAMFFLTLQITELWQTCGWLTSFHSISLCLCWLMKYLSWIQFLYSMYTSKSG